MADEPGVSDLLRDLNPAARRVVDAALAPVELRARETLFEPGEALDRVWFVRAGLVSLITVLRDGGEVDGMTVGRGGVLGLPTLLGSHRAVSRARVLIAGDGASLDADACRQAMELDRAFGARLMRYYEAVFAAVVHLSACNAAHGLEQRLCRFLLTCRDQVGADAIPLRQDDLARVLGVGRTSLAPVSRRLQEAGVFVVRHGRLRIGSPALLRQRACACHDEIAARFRATPDTGSS